jgi:inner membrane protein
MDILTHAISGLALGAAIATEKQIQMKNKWKIVALAGFGGIFPDFDAISLWSGFDNTFGKLFKLSTSGKSIYFSKLWYSHHGFFHSLFAGILFSFLIILTLFAIKKFVFRKHQSFREYFTAHILFGIAFLSGFLIHLFEDMPTPAGLWGGVRFFWPFKAYIGGTGEIWWWNNYDIFLVVFIVLILIMFFMIIQTYVSQNLRKFSLLTIIIGFIIVMIQIKSRDTDFNATKTSADFQELETKSIEIQKAKLGSPIYTLMSKFDRKVGVNF